MAVGGRSVTLFFKQKRVSCLLVVFFSIFTILRFNGQILQELVTLHFNQFNVADLARAFVMITLLLIINYQVESFTNAAKREVTALTQYIVGHVPYWKHSRRASSVSDLQPIILQSSRKEGAEGSSSSRQIIQLPLHSSIPGPKLLCFQC